MTVEAREESASIIYSRNAISIGDTLNINFKFLGDDENIRVFLRREDNSRQDLILDRDYYIETSSGINNIWGVVRFSKSFSLITKVCIYRDVSVSQEKKFDSQTIFSSTAEKALDKLTMLMQDNQLKNNVIRAPEDEKINNDTLVLPPATDRVEKYLYFDKNGKVTTVESEGLVRSLRQGSREEEVDPTFELRKEDRIGKIISFDAKGSVDLKILSPVAVSGNYNDLINKPILSTVATSGKYSDLTEKLIAGANVQINGITVSATDTTYNNATQSSDGLMSKDDKRKVDNLSTVATTANYNDLSNKPSNATTSVSGLMSSADKTKLDGVQSGAEVNVQSDWSVSDTQNDAYIKNKPNIPAAQVNSNWTSSSGVSQILNKPALATVATSGSYRDLNNKLVAGVNITIDSNNVISATGGGADITVGQGLQKNGNEISLKSAKPSGELGGVYLAGDPDEPLRVDEYGRLTLRVEEGIYVKHYEYDRSLALQKATASNLGGIKVGSGLLISSDGVLSASPQQQSVLVAGSGIRIDLLVGFGSSYSSSVNINSIWFSRGTYVAVGDNGTILKSYDSNTWDKISVPNVNQNLYRVRFLAEYFYVVGSNETILRGSSDGSNWSILYQNTSSFQSLRDISYTGEGGGTFVTVGDYGTVIYGNNTSWTKYNISGVPDLTGVIGGSNSYTAVGMQNNTSYIFKSTYGSDWTEVYKQAGTQISFIYYSSGMYYTVRWNYSSNTVLTSSDGSYWNSSSYTIPVTTKINSMYYSGTEWALVGDNGVILRGNALNNLSTVSLQESVTLKDVYYDYKEFYVLGGKNIYQESVIGQKISLA